MIRRMIIQRLRAGRCSLTSCVPSLHSNINTQDKSRCFTTRRRTVFAAQSRRQLRYWPSWGSLKALSSFSPASTQWFYCQLFRALRQLSTSWTTYSRLSVIWRHHLRKKQALSAQSSTVPMQIYFFQFLTW